MNSFAARGPSASFLSDIYPMPHPYLWEEDWHRWHHRDLAGMDAAALRREGRRVQSRLDHERDRHSRDWLTERLAAVRRALTDAGKGAGDAR